jgi:hypothetical protein
MDRTMMMMMTTSLAVNSVTEERMDRSNAEAKRARRLPSLSVVMFVLPVVLLYWQVGGPSGLLADPSTGVHVRAGQWILTHHAAPEHDLFSYTLPRKPWCDWEWGSDAMFALVYRLHGLSTVAAFALALLCLVSVVVYRTARLYAGPVAAAMTCVLVMVTTTIHWLARPHLFTWLALAILCWQLERPGSNKEFCALTAMMVLWENLHPGFVAGFLVLAAHFPRRSSGELAGNHTRTKEPIWRACSMVCFGDRCGGCNNSCKSLWDRT